jgi:hypothetical protein
MGAREGPILPAPATQLPAQLSLPFAGRKTPGAEVTRSTAEEEGKHTRSIRGKQSNTKKYKEKRGKMCDVYRFHVSEVRNEGL